MKVGDLITHNPTGAVGTIVYEHGDTVIVLWCSDPVNGEEGYEEAISKLFIEDLKENKDESR